MIVAYIVIVTFMHYLLFPPKVARGFFVHRSIIDWLYVSPNYLIGCWPWPTIERHHFKAVGVSSGRR